MRSNKMLVFSIAVFALMLGASWCFAAIIHPPAAAKAGPSQTLAITYFETKQKPDIEVQKCIQDKIATSDLKNQGIQVTVTNGQAVLTGDIKTPAHQSTAQQIARGCGAHKYILQQRRAR
jgi:osmotically-inducible protein OsmY